MDMETKVEAEIFNMACVPANMIDFVWDQVEPLIETVAKRAPDDIVTNVVKDYLYKGDKLLLVIARGKTIIAAHVLDVRVLESQTRVLYISISSGKEMDAWLDQFHKTCEAIAKDYSCTELRGLACRKGWMNKLQPYGWEEMFTTIRYKIGE
jgi:hypothetical protein